MLRFFLRCSDFSDNLTSVARYAQPPRNENQPRMSIRKSNVAPDHRAILRAKGWTLRPASQVLGVHWTHLHKVLNGTRHSASLLRRIYDLPTKPTHR